MEDSFYRFKAGSVRKTEFITQKKSTVISSILVDQSQPIVVLENLTISDLKKLVQIAKKRARICKDLGSFFVHLSPDVSILMKGKRK